MSNSINNTADCNSAGSSSSRTPNSRNNNGNSSFPSPLPSSTRQLSTANSTLSLGSSFITNDSSKKKKKWRRNFNDLITVRRKDLPDYESKERMITQQMASTANLQKKKDIPTMAVAAASSSVTTPSSKSMASQSNRKGLFKSMKKFGKSQVSVDGPSNMLDIEDEDYIRQNYFPDINGHHDVASGNNNKRLSDEIESYQISHAHNSSESSSLLNNLYTDHLGSTRPRETLNQSDDDNDLPFLVEALSNSGIVVPGSIERRSRESVHEIGNSKEFFKDKDPISADSADSTTSPVSRYFDTSNHINNDHRSHYQNKRASDITMDETRNPRTIFSSPPMSNDFDASDLQDYGNSRYPVALQDFLSDDNESTNNYGITDENIKQSELVSQNGSIQPLAVQNTMHSNTNGSYQENGTSTLENSDPNPAVVSPTNMATGNEIQTGGVSSKKRGFNPFSRLKPRLNILSGNRSISGSSSLSAETSISNNDNQTAASTGDSSAPQNENRGTRRDGSLLPSLNLSNARSHLSRFNSPMNSPINGSFSASNASTPTNGNFNQNNSSTNDLDNTSGFQHQARVLSRLLEQSAVSTLRNLIGDYNGEDGTRIDNRNRNRGLTSRVPTLRFEDGSDSNFAEFTMALQGTLLANELSNSVRLQMDRERRERQNQQNGPSAENDDNESENPESSTANDTSDDNATSLEPTAEDLRTQSMSFFRAFRFSSRRSTIDGEDDQEQVPVLILGVRSGLPEEIDRFNNNRNNNNSRSNNNSNNNNSGDSSDDAINNSNSQATPANEGGNPNNANNNGGGSGMSFFRNRNHRSRFRLENSRNSRRLEEIAQSYDQRTRARNENAHGAQRSWVIFVMGHSFPPDHAVLSAPTIMSENPTYDDLLALQAMLGRVKPLVATQEDVDRSGGLLKIVVDDVSGIKNSIIEEDQDNDEESDYESGDEGLEGHKRNEIATIKVVSNDSCPVCLCEYEDEDACRKLRACGHFFHQECIDQWLITGRNSCPLCRKKGVAVKKKKNNEGNTGTTTTTTTTGEINSIGGNTNNPELDFSDSGNITDTIPGPTITSSSSDGPEISHGITFDRDMPLTARDSWYVSS
ncbi:hypothetical protein DASC09_053380 [Saccharomycopsis crataegensis]|uniref:RING-type domain-containing protein n=1 Tax=Saccharomycopsis crataegensis TaxID=43959 RepID=A0AAV5QSW5_9ASCO|nr:hypothetical protein DASC09_053380 [Saccharomycopsis crataegensis]